MMDWARIDRLEEHNQTNNNHSNPVYLVANEHVGFPTVLLRLLTDRWCKRMMSQVMATGRAAIPFSLAASASRADNKLAALNNKTVQVGTPVVGLFLELSMVALQFTNRYHPSIIMLLYNRCFVVTVIESFILYTQVLSCCNPLNIVKVVVDSILKCVCATLK